MQHNLTPVKIIKIFFSSFLSDTILVPSNEFDLQLFKRFILLWPYYRLLRSDYEETNILKISEPSSCYTVSLKE